MYLKTISVVLGLVCIVYAFFETHQLHPPSLPHTYRPQAWTLPPRWPSDSPFFRRSDDLDNVLLHHENTVKNVAHKSHHPIINQRTVNIRSEHDLSRPNTPASSIGSHTVEHSTDPSSVDSESEHSDASSIYGVLRTPSISEAGDHQVSIIPVQSRPHIVYDIQGGGTRDQVINEDANTYGHMLIDVALYHIFGTIGDPGQHGYLITAPVPVTFLVPPALPEGLSWPWELSWQDGTGPAHLPSSITVRQYEHRLYLVFHYNNSPRTAETIINHEILVRLRQAVDEMRDLARNAHSHVPSRHNTPTPHGSPSSSHH